MDLYPYQRQGVDFLKSRKTALLADEMRLGKTVQAILAAAQADCYRVGVICPASVREVWQREFKRWWAVYPCLPLDLNVESYDKVTRGAFDKVDHFDVLILDEAHYLKSRKAKRTKKVLGSGKTKGLVHKADRVWALTGTPMPNHPGELYPLCATLFPDVVQQNGHRMDYWKFIGRFCKTFDNGFGIQISGGKNLADLKERLAPHVLRRRQKDVWADLPPMRYETVALEAAKIPEPDDATAKAILQAIEQGKEPSVEHVATYRRLIGEAKVEPIVDLLKEELEGGLEKIVVFAHHKKVVSDLFWALYGCGVVQVDGGVAELGRQKAVDRFQNDPDCRVFIGQLQAAGTGIALHAANDILFAEYSWVPAENQQAAMRCQHPEKKRSTFVRFASLAGSIDEAITEAVRRKTETISQVFA